MGLVVFLLVVAFAIGLCRLGVRGMVLRTNRTRRWAELAAEQEGKAALPLSDGAINSTDSTST